MNLKYIFSFILFLLISCNISTISDGVYCVEVERYNPRTLKESSYTLTAEVKNEKLVRLYFPNGGYIDYDDFNPSNISSGTTSFSDFRGVQFKVKIIKKGTDCFDAFPELKRCTAITKSGERCKNKTRNKSGRCYLHDKNK